MQPQHYFIFYAKSFSSQVIKNKFTGEPASYGFINFDSDPAALMAMHKLNGKIIPNSTPVSEPLPSPRVV